MVLKRTVADLFFDFLNVSFLLLLVFLTVYPTLYSLFASISDPLRIVQHTGMLWGPLGFSLGAYVRVFENPMISSGYLITLTIIVVGTSLNLLLTSFGAYFLSRKKLLWRDPIMFFMVFTMFFSGGLIPLFLTVRSLGMMNSLWALIVPTAINTYNLIVMRTAFAAIPDSIEESAKMDGANDFTVLFRIILPLSTAVVAVMILFYGVNHWNSWFNAMIFLRKRELYPLQLVLREILIQNAADQMMSNVGSLDVEPVGETIRYATIIVATLPIVTVYPFLQRYFVQGVMIGALKG
jgi:putative aldouronate transport system permease protein